MKSIAQVKLFKGFSMIEVLIATVVLGVGLVGIAQFQGSVMKNSSLSKQRIEAINFAEEKLENLRHFSTPTEWNNNVLGSLSGTESSTDNAYLTNGSPKYSLATYTLKYEIDPSTDGTRANISIKVTWPNATGANSSDTEVYLATVLSNSTPLTLATSSGGTFTLPQLPVIDIPDTTLNSKGIPNGACNCDAILAALDFRTFAYNFMNGYVKVGGMSGGMGGMSSGSTSGGTNTTYSQECTDCCTAQYADLIDEQKYYAALMLKEFMQDRTSFKRSKYDDRAVYEQAKYEDRVIDNNPIQEKYLVKSYNPTVWDNINNYIKTMGGGMTGCGMSCTSSTMTYGYAYCTFITPPSGTKTVMSHMKCN